MTDVDQYVPFARQGDQVPLFEEPTSLTGDGAVVTARLVLAALVAVREDLRELRERRAAINAAIKSRVTQEAHLARMARIATELLEGGDEDDGDGVGVDGVDD